MGGRDLPEEAYLEAPCPRCGGQQVDIMGDDYCLQCDFGHQKEGEKKTVRRKKKPGGTR